MDKNTSIRTNVMLPKELHEIMKKEAKRLGLSLSGFICVSANEYLKQSSVVDMVKFMQLTEEKPQEMAKQLAGMMQAILQADADDGDAPVLRAGAPSPKRSAKGNKKPSIV